MCKEPRPPWFDLALAPAGVVLRLYTPDAEGQFHPMTATLPADIALELAGYLQMHAALWYQENPPQS